MIDTWVILSLISAFSLATSDALTKKVITRENEYVIAWYRVVVALPALLVALALSGRLPGIDNTFLASFFTAIPLEVAAILLYYKALRVSPLSLSLPFLSFTPVFLIVISFVFMHQAISLSGAAGIALIGLGGYALNLSVLRSGFLEPIRAVTRERGSLYMLIVALIFSATSALGKIGVDHSSPAFFGFTYYLVLAICMLVIIVRRNSRVGILDLLQSRRIVHRGGMHLRCAGQALRNVRARRPGRAICAAAGGDRRRAVRRRGLARLSSDCAGRADDRNRVSPGGQRINMAAHHQVR